MDPAEPPSPVEDALAQLGKLAAAGSAPERVTRTVGEIVAGWAAEDGMNGAVAQARIERLWDSLGTDAAELQAQIGDAAGEGAQALAGARRILAALNAAVAALAAAHERL